MWFLETNVSHTARPQWNLKVPLNDSKQNTEKSVLRSGPAWGPSESEAVQRGEMRSELGSRTRGISGGTCASLRVGHQQLRPSQLSWDKGGGGQLA